MMRGLTLSASLLLVLAAQLSWAQVPQTISYQGQLTDASGELVDDGPYDLAFSLYDSETGVTPLWSESHLGVGVENGIFSVILGQGTPPVPLTLSFDQPYWLEVQVGTTVLAPRIALTSSPYSLNALSVVDGAVTTSKLADNAVTTSHITNGTITGDDIAGSTVTSDKIADGQVVKSINGKTDAVTLAGGDNVSVTTSGNTLTVSATGLWKLGGNAGTTPGKHFLGTTDDRPLELRVDGQRVMRISLMTAGPLVGANIIGGYEGNTVGDGVLGATLFGGGASVLPPVAYPNSVKGQFGTVSGGRSNTASAWDATVGGGDYNTASGSNSTVAGGTNNIASEESATIPGGSRNLASGQYSFAAGRRAKAEHNGSFVWGDSTNADVASTGNDQFVVRAGGGAYLHGSGLTISDTGDALLILDADTDNVTETHNPGIVFRQDGGFVSAFIGYAEGTDTLSLANEFNHSIVAGRNASTDQDGCFVWGDSSAIEVSPEDDDQFIVQADGGSRFYTSSDLSTGVKLLHGSGQWTDLSDRRVKRNIRPVDVKEILYKLAQIPISRWGYKAQDPGIDHIGPMSQDFYRAFGLGSDHKGIGTLDANGVALAAIQGLYEIVEEKDATIAEQQQQIAAMEKRLRALEDLVK